MYWYWSGLTPGRHWRCLTCVRVYVNDMMSDGLRSLPVMSPYRDRSGRRFTVQDLIEMFADIPQIGIDPSPPGTTTP